MTWEVKELIITFTNIIRFHGKKIITVLSGYTFCTTFLQLGARKKVVNKKEITNNEDNTGERTIESSP